MSARHPLARPGLPPGLMQSQGRIPRPQLMEAQAVAVAASFAPDAFQGDAFQTSDTETFLERYRGLSEKDQDAIKEGLLLSLVALGDWIYALANEDKGQSMIALCFLVIGMYFLLKKITDV
jgi:hypothetical protein